MHCSSRWLLNNPPVLLGGALTQRGLLRWGNNNLNVALERPWQFFFHKLAKFDFRCMNVCVQPCSVCLSPRKHALFGLCLTSYLLPSPRGTLVSVWPCRAILPLVPAHSSHWTAASYTSSHASVRMGAEAGATQLIRQTFLSPRCNPLPVNWH